MAGPVETSAARLARDISSQPAERIDRWYTNMVAERKGRLYQ